MIPTPRICSFLVLMLLLSFTVSRLGGGWGGIRKLVYVTDTSSEKPLELVVISSSGETAQRFGGVLGQFEYHEDNGTGYYVQSSTEQSNEQFLAVYLYRDKDDKWTVGPTHDQNKGWLFNPRPSNTRVPPISGWQWGDGDDPTRGLLGRWHDDPSITVTPGPLPPLPRQFTVTASEAAAKKYPSCFGVFTRTERWWRGRPVYVNTEGRLLHQGSDYGWSIGNKLGWTNMRGSRARDSPSDENSWRYWNGSEFIPASVNVTASD